MKKAIKKTCVVLLLFALLVSQVAASYSETGTLNEGTSAISAAERYLSNWAYNSYMYADKNLTLGTVLDAEVEPAKLTLATSEIMALRNDADGQENNISVAVSKMQANIQFMIDKATYFSTIRQYNGLQRTDFNTDYVVQRVDVQGNFAVIEVLENISFQYVGAEDSSFSQKEHTVSLIKVDGEWIVANVETKYDWFANEYKDTEYKISSIIAAEKQNIQAQAECSANEDSVVSAAPAEDEMVAEVLANASFARMYNKENAWKYAYTYATSTTTSTANSYYTTCTGANTSHTFSSTNSKCARCGYVRTYIIPTLLIPMAKNTQITLTARTNHTVSSISMSVKNPNGATTNLGTVTNTNSISKVYTPTVAAHPNDLYTVTVTAVSADGVTTSSTWTFRTY